MLRVFFGIFMVLHGLVHLLYLGQSSRLFELQSGMVWPDGSWAFSKLLGDDSTRVLAGIACAIAAAIFVSGGIGILAGQGWWRSLVVAASAFSAVLFILFWNGKMQQLDDQGGIGVLINIAILTAVLIVQWPDFDF